jgi:hypothetical protein
MRTSLVVFAAALALGACTKKADQPAASGEPAKAAASPGLSLAGPTALPTRTPGLWEMKMSSDRESAGAMPVVKLCTDAASEQKLSVFSAQGVKDACKDIKVDRQLDGSWKVSSTCTFGGAGTTTSVGTISGDFNSHYQVKTASTIAGAKVAQMNGSHTMTIDATRLGPCEAGQTGGDMILPNGMKMNILTATAPK